MRAIASVEKILRGVAFSVSQKSPMEFDDAYQELAIAELHARTKFRLDYETKDGRWITYETYLRKVLEGYSIKLVSKAIKSVSYSLDLMLDQENEEGGPRNPYNQRYIAFDEKSYSRSDWNILVKQVAVDEVDVFIMNKLMDGWTQSEIANLLDYTQPAIRQRLNRYRATMEKLMAA